MTVDVVNDGDAPALVDKASIEGTDAGEFKLHGSDCGQVDPGQHCSVWVSFAPGSTGEKQATLGIVPKEGSTWTVPIAGSAVPPQISFSPSVYDFGVQQVNRGESGNVQLINSGEAAIQVGSYGIGGPDANNFGAGGGDCSGGRWLQPGEGCNVQVYFNPHDMVSYEAKLQAQAYGETFSADLSGSGGRAIVEAEANPVEFGAAAVGSAGIVKTIDADQPRQPPRQLLHRRRRRWQRRQLPADRRGLHRRAGRARRHLHGAVRFAPQGTGPKAARFALFGNDEGGTMVMLTGEALAAVEVSAATGSTAVSAPPVGARARHRFARGAGLFAGRARCHGAKLCRKAKALRARTAVVSG